MQFTINHSLTQIINTRLYWIFFHTIFKCDYHRYIYVSPKNEFSTRNPAPTETQRINSIVIFSGKMARTKRLYFGFNGFRCFRFCFTVVTTQLKIFVETRNFHRLLMLVLYVLTDVVQFKQIFCRFSIYEKLFDVFKVFTFLFGFITYKKKKKQS